MKRMIPVIVATVHRGVFFGYLPEDFEPCETLRVSEARMIVYWPAATRGFTGLAALGPLPGAQVGPPAPAITLYGVSAVMEVPAELAAAYEAGPWGDD